MADGSTKRIEDVRVGDLVLATDPKTGEAGGRMVLALIVGQGDKDLVEVTVDTDGDAGDDTGTVIATDGHPFWVENLGAWVDAKDLRPGDMLRTSAGTWVQVQAVHEFQQHQRVHNLTVAGIHTYHVTTTNTDLLVHNCGKQVAADYRADPRNGVGKRRNVAVAQYDIDGVSGQLIGVSGRHTNPSSVAASTKRRFNPGDRPFDLENKILEGLAARISPNSKGGLISILREVCPSCEGVIDQFQKAFPGIRINVTWR